jgi:hypothetical protein
VSNPTDPPRGGQGSRRSPPGFAGASLLFPLFSLQHGAPDFAPLRAALSAARCSLEALRFVAEDAVDVGPVMPLEAQRADVHARGADLREHLVAAQLEVDVLDVFLRGGQHHVS